MVSWILSRLGPTPGWGARTREQIARFALQERWEMDEWSCVPELLRSDATLWGPVERLAARCGWSRRLDSLREAILED